MEIELRCKILEFIKHFLKHDKYKAMLYCKKWDGSNGKWFSAKEPEDFVMELMTGLYNGKICYTKSYRHFLGSVYFHLNLAMKSYFNYRDGEVRREEQFSEEDAENYLNSYAYTEGAEIIFKEMEREDIREHFFRCFDREKESKEIMLLEEILKGGKREFIAAELKITPAEYTIILKRVHSKIKKRLDARVLEEI